MYEGVKMALLCQICDLNVSPLEPTASRTIMVCKSFLLGLDPGFKSGTVVNLNKESRLANWLMRDVLEVKQSGGAPSIVKWPSLCGRDPALWTLDRVFIYFHI